VCKNVHKELFKEIKNASAVQKIVISVFMMNVRNVKSLINYLKTNVMRIVLMQPLKKMIIAIDAPKIVHNAINKDVKLV